MSENINRVEPHGCIVCGRTYDMLVVYAPDGRMVDCTVTSPGGQPAADRVIHLRRGLPTHPAVGRAPGSSIYQQMLEGIQMSMQASNSRCRHLTVEVEALPSNSSYPDKERT